MDLMNEDVGLVTNLNAALPDLQRIDHQRVNGVVIEDSLGQPNSPATTAPASRSPNPPPAQRAGRITMTGDGVTHRVTLSRDPDNQLHPAAVNPSYATVGGSQPVPSQPASSQSVAGVANPSQPVAGAVAPVNMPPQPANGSRLNVNRVENASGVVSESRDPSRQNAVIHMSYIKK